MENIGATILMRYFGASAGADLPFETPVGHPTRRRPEGMPALPNILEIVDAFPEAEKYLKARRRRIRAEEKEALCAAEEELRDSLSSVYRGQFSETNQTFLVDIAKETFENRKRRYSRELKRIDRYLGIYKGKRSDSEGRITEEDIARAKQYPIREIIEVTRRDGMVCCPLHTEKTPSCKIYNDNHWHCYGSCNTGGDVIDLVMAMQEMDFIPAVKYLTGKT